MKITRTRYIITRNNGAEIYCVNGQYCDFRPIDTIGNATVKTYSSRENTAFERWSDAYRKDCRVEEVVETIESVEAV